jgi:hypothetical protein
MVGLVDIAPAVEKVDCGGARPIECYGVSARGVASLLGRFPELRKMMSGGEVGADDLMKMAPDAISAIIAAGVGKPGDPETEESADRLPIDTQIDLIAAILRLTMPKGVGPFVEKLASAMGSLNVDGQSASAPATTSRKR